MKPFQKVKYFIALFALLHLLAARSASTAGSLAPVQAESTETPASGSDFVFALSDLLLILASIAVGALLIFAVNWYFFARKKETAAINQFTRQITMLGTTLLVLALIIWLNPSIGASIKGDLFKFIGLIITIVITLASTTLVSNAMAGLMLRAVRSFHPGDFIRVSEHFGGVTEMGLFHTEIQTEDRDLITLPNLYLVSNPVRVIRSSGTFISTQLSLGYDVPRTRVKKLLMAAAKNAELQDPLFRVGDLGDYSVTYQIAGFLKDIESMPLVRSKLRSCVLDALHEAKIEIVSPAFMNQRRLPDDALVLPERTRHDSPTEDIEADKVLKEKVFDKTMEAGKTEKRRFELKKLNEEIEKLKADLKEADERATESLEKEIHKKERRVKVIVRVLEAEENEKKE